MRLPVLIVCAALLARAQAPSISGLQNGASNISRPVAPGELVSIFGANLGDNTAASCSNGGDVPLTCAGVSIQVGGKPAAVAYVSSTQLGCILPVDLSGSTANLVVT